MFTYYVNSFLFKIQSVQVLIADTQQSFSDVCILKDHFVYNFHKKKIAIISKLYKSNRRISFCLYKTPIIISKVLSNVEKWYKIINKINFEKAQKVVNLFWNRKREKMVKEVEGEIKCCYLGAEQFFFIRVTSSCISDFRFLETTACCFSDIKKIGA